jgi:hypothetical protein
LLPVRIHIGTLCLADFCVKRQFGHEIGPDFHPGGKGNAANDLALLKAEGRFTPELAG